MKNLRYFYFIDLLRWFAAMGVLIHHYFAHFKINSTDANNSNIFNFISDNSILGSYGVWFFWCVSGFVFTNILINQKTTLFNFALKRFSRLYPLHFLTLILISLLEFSSLKFLGNFQIKNHFYDFYHFILNLLFISEWGLQKGYSFNGVIWSVSIEIPVYFAFFTLIYFLKRSLLMYVFLFLIFSKLILHTDLFNYQLKACFFYFLFGSFIYLFCLKFEKYKFFFISFSLLGILSWPFFLELEKIGYFKTLVNFIPTTLVLFGSLILFAFFIENNYKNIGKKISFLGDASYAIYLIHIPVQVLTLILIELELIKLQSFNSLAIFVLFLIFINIISVILFKYFENPIRKKLNKLYISR